MKYDFDKITNRKGTNCLKYDFAVERGKNPDVLPLWVADMDFPTSDYILEKLHAAVDHGIFGYSEGKEEYFAAVYGWFKNHFDWEVKPEWLVKTPGVVYAIATAVAAYTNPGDGVLINQPVYYPFSEAIRDNGRKIINSPLVLKDGHYEIDFADLEKKIIEENVKLYLLCSPHNPVGRVWTREELAKIGEICVKHQVIILADEIHCDFTFPGYKHTVLASLSEEIADITITCTAPSKTFNLAGLQISNLFIKNEELRGKFKKQIAATGYSQLNSLGLVGCQAAYEGGEEWLLQLKDYLKGNLDYMREFLEKELPYLHLIEPEGTYLIWVDFRELGMTEEEREDLIVNKAKLWLDSGAIFGADGEGFERFNIACPRETLTQALTQLRDALGAR